MSTAENSDGSFLDNILTPGSSLHPTFLLLLDLVLALLSILLLTLSVISSWNLHLLALLGITLGLWGSVKWFVLELQQTGVAEPLQVAEDKKQQ